MWTCPICKQQFHNQNQSHSCGLFSVDDFLQNKSERSIQLFWHFLNTYKKIGPFELHPVKTRVALLTQIRFASVNKLGKDFVDGYLLLASSRNEARIFYKTDNLNNRLFVHHFRVYEEDEIGESFMKYMHLAYGVGQREHTKDKVKSKK